MTAFLMALVVLLVGAYVVLDDNDDDTPRFV